MTKHFDASGKFPEASNDDDGGDPASFRRREGGISSPVGNRNEGNLPAFNGDGGCAMSNSISDRPMTAAERQRRCRAKQRAQRDADVAAWTAKHGGCGLMPADLSLLVPAELVAWTGDPDDVTD